MKLKNSFELQAYYQRFLKHGNCAATLLPVENENKVLRRNLRGRNRDTDSTFPENAVTVQQHLLDSKMPASNSFDGNVDVAQNDDEIPCAPATQFKVTVPSFVNLATANLVAARLPAPPQKSPARKKARYDFRCRKCGHYTSKSEHMKCWHAWNKPGDMVCTVPPTLYLPGFPLDPVQKRFPRYGQRCTLACCVVVDVA
jgi:hypothetical protein